MDPTIIWSLWLKIDHQQDDREGHGTFANMIANQLQENVLFAARNTIGAISPCRYDATFATESLKSVRQMKPSRNTWSIGFSPCTMNKSRGSRVHEKDDAVEVFGH
jgi:hypothetical protein